MIIKGAEKLIARLDYYANKLGTDVVNTVSKKALKTLKSKYASTGHNDYICKIEKGEKSIRISVKGDDVLFTEYGTGIYSKGLYPKAYLPTRTFRFVSAGKLRQTQGWKYYYPNKNTKRVVKDLAGWFVDRHFEIGNPPEKQLYETLKETRKYLKSVIKNKIKEI